MSEILDPRINAYRPDIAAIELDGQVESEKFVEGTEHQVTTGIIDLRGTPDDMAPKGKAESQLLFGEIFTVYEEKDGWCWGQNNNDSYVGYVPTEALSPRLIAPSHCVCVPRTHVYSDHTIKSPIIDTLSMASAVSVEEHHSTGFWRLQTGGWVYSKHLVPFDHQEKDYVATALRFLETPYVWGGRSGLGIDCSALVQISLQMAGIKAPRDSDLQEDVLGRALKTAKPKKGDLVYFEGHVGIMMNEKTLLHANAFHMRVTTDPLDEVAKRTETGITSIRRLK